MKFFNKKIHIGTCFMISLAIAALTFTITAVTLLNFVNSRLESLSKKELEMGKIANVRSIIDEYYIGEPNESQMTESALYGYVAGIGDKYSRYYNAEEYAALTNQTSGKMVGIGVQSIMDKDTGFIKITEVFAGSPALKNDLRPGDLIYAVDGQNVLDIGYEAAITKIKGAKGDLVILSVQRGDKKLDISVIPTTRRE